MARELQGLIRKAEQHGLTHCLATSIRLECSCHRGYIYQCTLGKHGEEVMHRSLSVHGTNVYHTYQWSEDAQLYLDVIVNGQREREALSRTRGEMASPATRNGNRIRGQHSSHRGTD